MLFGNRNRYALEYVMSSAERGWALFRNNTQ